MSNFSLPVIEQSTWSSISKPLLKRLDSFNSILSILYVIGIHWTNGIGCFVRQDTKKENNFNQQ